MKILLKTLGIVAIVLILVVIILLVQFGFFSKVNFNLEEIGQIKVVYLEHKGSYSKIVEKMENVTNFLKKNKIPTSAGFGEYYDNPMYVKQDDLRSIGGCVISNEIKFIKISEPYKTKTFEKRLYVTTIFTGLPYIGPIIVYPKSNKWLQNNGYEISGPVIEIYKTANKKMTVHYLFPVKKK